jgi:hypothetical protein
MIEKTMRLTKNIGLLFLYEFLCMPYHLASQPN